MSQPTTAGNFVTGDTLQSGRAPDWLAPNIASLVPIPIPTARWTYWDPSIPKPSLESTFSLATAYATQLTPATVRPPGQWTYFDPSRSTPSVESTVALPIQFIFQASPASYLLLIDHYLPGGYAVAGTTVTEGGMIPFGWTPTLAVDPLNTKAIQTFWNAGPGPLVTADPGLEFFPNLPRVFRKPQVYWQLISPGVYQLTGAGATLGTKGSG